MEANVTGPYFVRNEKANDRTPVEQPERTDWLGWLVLAIGVIGTLSIMVSWYG